MKWGNVPLFFQASEPGPDHGDRLRRLASGGNNAVFYTHTNLPTVSQSI